MGNSTNKSFFAQFRPLFIPFIIMVFIFGNLFSQNNSLYMSNLFKRAYEKQTRSYDGKPGKNYWQNRVKYDISASFNPASKVLKGNEEITYFNNSPDTLKWFVVKLLQDLYKTGNVHAMPVSPAQQTEGMNIAQFSVNGEKIDLNNRRQAFRAGTNMRVFLQPGKYLNPGGSIKLNVEWSYKEIRDGFRVGEFTDSSFFFGYWYPQMAVYDDYQGWDLGDYTANQETYNDLADYNVEISMPSNYLVWATGDLMNAAELYNQPVLDKIESSKKSNEVVKIITKDDYNSKLLKGSGQLVWKYSAKNVPDFSFAASSYYLWDACSAVSDLKNNKTVWVNSIYPPTGDQFKNVAAWAKESIEFLSTKCPGIPYLYDKHFTYNGHRQTAMEFPMMANNRDGNAQIQTYVFELTAHEIAHGYLPFYTLSNEREFAWMDEGFVKLFGEMTLENRNVKRPESRFLNTITIYRNLAGTIYDVPLMTPSSYLSPAFEFSTSYAKSATALYYLIEILEEKGIKNPLKLFLETWKDKHPLPYDFFFFMNSLAKEDLSWYWKPWYFEFSAPDLGIKEIKQNKNGAEIIIENCGGIPSPAVINITFEDDTVQKIKKSASVWKNSKTYTEKITGKKKIKSVMLGDPYVVDSNPANNSYQSK